MQRRRARVGRARPVRVVRGAIVSLASVTFAGAPPGQPPRTARPRPRARRLDRRRLCRRTALAAILTDTTTYRTFDGDELIDQRARRPRLAYRERGPDRDHLAGANDGRRPRSARDGPCPAHRARARLPLAPFHAGRRDGSRARLPPRRRPRRVPDRRSPHRPIRLTATASDPALLRSLGSFMARSRCRRESGRCSANRSPMPESRQSGSGRGCRTTWPRCRSPLPRSR